MHSRSLYVVSVWQLVSFFIHSCLTFIARICHLGRRLFLLILVSLPPPISFPFLPILTPLPLTITPRREGSDQNDGVGGDNKVIPQWEGGWEERVSAGEGRWAVLAQW